MAQSLIKEVFERQDIVKEQLASSQKELISSFKRHADVRLQEIAATAREVKFVRISLLV